MIIAELFVEDALIYLVTHLPFLYFFSDPVLLFSISHLTSFLYTHAANVFFFFFTFTLTSLTANMADADSTQSHRGLTLVTDAALVPDVVG